MTIRPARLDDWESIRGVFIASTDGADPPDRFRQAIASIDRRVTVLVTEDREKLVGFAIGRPSGDDDAAPETGEVDGLFVLPSHWRQGIGRSLLAETLAFLRAVGFREATLWTGEDNERARAIYGATGWRVDGARRPRAGRIDELRYRIDL